MNRIDKYYSDVEKRMKLNNEGWEVKFDPDQFGAIGIDAKSEEEMIEDFINPDKDAAERPNHYVLFTQDEVEDFLDRDRGIQVKDVIKKIVNDADLPTNNCYGLVWNMMKYLLRFPYKGKEIQDLRKAIQLGKLLEEELDNV